MNPTNIDWPGLDFTWNPVVGCKRGCDYCYAKKINDRFHIVEDFTKPEYFKKRILEPYRRGKPATIFVGSMSDFTYWPEAAQVAVVKTCKHNPHHTFMFLSKDDCAFQTILWPTNCILGLTITRSHSERMVENVNNFTLRHKRTFLSVEPLLGPVLNPLPEKLEHVIVGPMTGPGAVKPKPEWIQSVIDNTPADKLYWKRTMKPYLEAM